MNTPQGPSPARRTRRHFTASAFVAWEGRVLLLLHRSKHLWLPPGGHVEPDEEPAAAAVREAWEETGLRVEITSAPAPPGERRALPRPEAVLQVEVEPGHIHLDLVYFARPVPGASLELRPNEEAIALHWWSASDLRATPPAGLPAPAGDLPAEVARLALLRLSAPVG